MLLSIICLLKFIKKNYNLKGKLAISLVREFLEFCNLDYTISVLDPEINSVNNYKL